MFIDYRRLVLQDYQRKKLANAISLNLIHPTPASLRNECVENCNARYEKKDDNCLKAFFGQYNDEASCKKAIARCEIDKFRPVINFLKRKTSEPDAKIVELLAWLIDFEPRPFELNQKYDVEEIVADVVENNELPTEEVNTNAVEYEEEDESGGVIYSSSDGKKPQPTEKNTNNLYVESAAVNKNSSPGKQTFLGKGNYNLKKIGVLAVIFSLFVGVGGYWRLHHTDATNNNNLYGSILPYQEKCMYWAEDHYESISCDQKTGDKILVPFDSVKLNHLKKITRPDTITSKVKGSVWYSKIKNNVEFYTSDGCHPIDTQIRLKPLTDYMINKHILHEAAE